jgi:hypothetical protein
MRQIFRSWLLVLLRCNIPHGLEPSRDDMRQAVQTACALRASAAYFCCHRLGSLFGLRRDLLFPSGQATAFRADQRSMLVPDDVDVSAFFACHFRNLMPCREAGSAGTLDLMPPSQNAIHDVPDNGFRLLSRKHRRHLLVEVGSHLLERSRDAVVWLIGEE